MSTPRKPEPRAPRAPRPSRPPKPRLLQVRVEPVFVLDHGTTLEPVEHAVVVVAAKDWPTYSSERFPREVAEWEQRLANPEPPAGA